MAAMGHHMHALKEQSYPLNTNCSNAGSTSVFLLINFFFALRIEEAVPEFRRL